MKRIVPLVVGMTLTYPGAALAQGGSGCNSSDQTYGSQACQVSSNASQQTATTSTVSSSTLPFTGLDVELLAAGGGVLLGAGLLVRRLSRDSG